MPLTNVGREQPKIHILDNTERKSFFDAVDSYIPDSKNAEDHWMADEYPVMFRLFYCCGMRNDEVCSLKTTDVDFEKGIITMKKDIKQTLSTTVWQLLLHICYEV